jgi:hypothetical protein
MMRYSPQNNSATKTAQHTSISLANSSGLCRFSTNVPTRMRGTPVAMAMRFLDLGNRFQFRSAWCRTHMNPNPPSEPTTKHRIRKPHPPIRSMCMLRAARNTTTSTATSINHRCSRSRFMLAILLRRSVVTAENNIAISPQPEWHHSRRLCRPSEFLMTLCNLSASASSDVVGFGARWKPSHSESKG